MGEGNGNGKAPVLGCGMNECVPEKTTCGAKAVCLYDPTFYHLCFSESWIRMFFQVSGIFSESGGKFCRIEVRHFFPPKGGSRYIKLLIILTR